MRIGIDCDGVLANFNQAFIQRTIEVTGRNLFPEDYEPQTWNYPEGLGYLPEEVGQVWRSIEQDRLFWATLPAYPTTRAFIAEIENRPQDDFYFITARPGIAAKRQTEDWLLQHTSWCRTIQWTVLVSPHKGLCAQALSLDRYLDDRWENAESVATTSTKSYLLDRPWNRFPDDRTWCSGITRINHPSEIFCP